jgi:hypothetical protein
MRLWLVALTSLGIGLKLTNQIAWSWWWVLAPCWVPVAIYCLAMALALVAIKWKPEIEMFWDD